MKIEGFKTYHVSKPLSVKLPNSSYVIENMEHILLEVEAGGYLGIGFVYNQYPAHAEAMRIMMEDYGKGLIGKDATMIRQHLNRANLINSPTGPAGLPTCAYAAWDEALWDILSQKAGLPLYKMLGAGRNEVPVYASGGWLVPLEDLVAEAVGYKNEGYTIYKMKLGCKDFHEDLRRIRAVREACGDGLEIYVDVNMGWDAKKTILIAPMLKELGVRYLEEPVPAQNIPAHQEVRSRTDLYLAAGESLSFITEQYELIRNRCVDMLNPDLMKCGGVTNYVQVCSLAGAFNIPVTAHLNTEYACHVIAAAPTGLNCEFVPDWWNHIFDRRPNIKNGMILLDDTPGVGYKFNHDYIKDHLYKA